MNKMRAIPRRMFYQVFFPSVISALTLSIADIADALVVGNRAGGMGLMVIGIVTPVYMLFNLIGYGFSTGGSVIFGRLSADGRTEEVRAHFRTLLVWLMALSAVIAVLGNVLIRPIFSLLGVSGSNAQLLAMCITYARPLFAATPIFMLNFLLYDFVRYDNDAALASLGYSAGSMVDLGLNIVLVLFLNMGVLGAILSTVAAQTLSVLILSRHFFTGKGMLTFRGIVTARDTAGKASKYAVRSLSIGFSTSVRYLFQFIFLSLSNRLLLDAGARGAIDGERYVAVFDVVMNVSFVTVSLYQAAADAMQPMVTVFSEERNRFCQRYVRRLALVWGLASGTAVTLVIALLAGPVSVLFGIPEALEVSVPAIRIFCLSMPAAGYLLIQIGYDQSSGNSMLAGGTTMLRTAVILLPVTLVMGLFFPARFWWVFPITEYLTLLISSVGQMLYGRRRQESQVQVFTESMDNENRDLSRVMEKLTEFCDKNEMDPRLAVRLQLSVEELCLVTFEKAFTGKKEEYIQLTVVLKDEDCIVHIRNSAPVFNPLEMRMGKVHRGMEEDLLDSMGVMMVRKKAKDLQYRHYEGCNMLTVIL